MRKSQLSPVSDDRLDFSISQRQTTLARLETELQSLQRQAALPIPHTFSDIERQLEDAQNRLCQIRREAEERENESLRMVLERTRAAANSCRFRAAALTQESEALQETLQAAMKSAFFIDQARSQEQAKLAYLSAGCDQDRTIQALYMTSGVEDVRERSAVVSDFVTHQAQVRLRRDNFLERTKFWRQCIDSHERRHSQLAPQSAALRYSPHSHEADVTQKRVRMLFQVFGEVDVENCVEKFFKTVHATQRLSANINQLLQQQAEMHSLKSALKTDLYQLHVSQIPPRNHHPTPSVPPRAVDKTLNTLRLLAFDVSSMSTGILAKVDRVDTVRALGPHVSELAYSGDGGAEHCVAVFLVLEKKLRNCQEFAYQRKTARPTGPSRLPPLSSKSPPPRKSMRKTPAAFSVNAIKRRIYVSHFVQNSPLVRVEAMLGEVAQMHVSIKSSFKQLPQASHHSPHLAPTDRELEESNYLRLTQQSKKKQKSLSPVASPLEGKQKTDMTLSASQLASDLSRSSQHLQRERQQSMKELLEELSGKRCEVGSRRLIRLAKDRRSDRLPEIRSGSSSPSASFAFHIAPHGKCHCQIC